MEPLNAYTPTRRMDLGPIPDLLEPDLVAPNYIEAPRRYNARRTAFYRGQWMSFYRRMEELHSRLAAEHQAKADALISGEGADG